MSINLLPWREKRRKQKHKKLICRIMIYIIFLFLLSLMIKLFIYLELRHAHLKMIVLNHQMAAITLRDPRNQNTILLKKLIYFHAQQKLARLQNEAVQTTLFHIANVIPNSIILNQLAIDTKKILLAGKSDQLADIHQYINALQAKETGENVQLIDIQTDDKSHSIMRFTIEIDKAQRHEKNPSS